jgi:cytoskeletal protein CcmA (bactofilin family)
MPLQIRRGTNAERIAHGAAFAPGELVYVTDTQKLYIGDGTTNGGVQVTGFDAEDAVDAVGAALLAGTHQNIAFTYGTTQDNANRIDATVSIATLLSNLNLNNFNINGNGNIQIQGEVRANVFVGSVFPDGSSLGGRALVDGIDAKIELDGTVKGDIVPSTDSVYDLGSSSHKFKDLYLSGSSLHLGSAVVTASGTAVNLPLGSTIGGNAIVAASQDSSGSVLKADIAGSVFGDDSTMIVDGTSGKIHTNNIVSNSGTLTIGDVSPLEHTNVSIYSGNVAPAIFVNAEVGGSPGLGQLGPVIRISSTNGTFASPSVLGTGDLLGQYTFSGYVNGGTFGELTSDLVFLRSVVSDAGDLVSNFAKGKFQIFLADVVTPGNSKVAEFSSNGAFSAPIMQVGSFDNSAETAIASPSIGMIIYNTSTNKFRGYSNTGWVDLN